MLAPDPLHGYKSKRNFSATPEPAGDGASEAPNADGLSFVVQKHWASRLHYDFRLELDGTMKSWAVPKGPSLDPRDKRMAVQVEDHPIAYSNFEGTIPPKQYGAGKVVVWDKGTWQPFGDPRRGYTDGNLKFQLHGHKLHGRWVLVRIKGAADAASSRAAQKQAPWLLIKEKDAFVRSAAEYSVVDECPDSVSALAKRTPLDNGVESALPATLEPQLATLAERPARDSQQWIHEIKFDGYRMLARVEGADIRLITRHGHDWTSKLPALKQALTDLQWPPGWYDGEIVVQGANGVPDFGALQAAFETGQTDAVVFYLFDLPFFDGRDLRRLALQSRRAMLAQLFDATASDQVRFSDVFDAAADSLLASAYRLGLEGLIAKRRGSSYVSGRSADWIKLKCGRRQEFVIGGYTAPRGTRSGLGALLLGVHDAQGQLRYAGNVGTGFSQRSLDDLVVRLDAISAPDSPFFDTAPDTAGIEGTPRWVTPTLIAEVSFGEWTRSGRIRHAVFRGLRSDKEANAVMREDSPPSLAEQLRVTHPERVIDTRSGTTKIELLQYYARVGELMMQHLKGRPVALLRAPEGVGGELFFQKHAETGRLPGIRQLDPALYISHPPMLEVASRKGLLSAAQWNVIEFHTLNTGTRSFEHPDRMVFDLDPGEGVQWTQVQEAAELVHAFLLQLGLTSFLKTSGGKGLHVVVPLRKLHDWDTVKGFSHAIVSHLSATIPQRFVAKSGPKQRIGKIFIDYLRNGLGASTVCAWSARARPGLGISVPVAWNELASLRGGDHWTVRTAHTRLDVGNAPWDGYRRAARGLNAAMKTLHFTGP